MAIFDEENREHNQRLQLIEDERKRKEAFAAANKKIRIEKMLPALKEISEFFDEEVSAITSLGNKARIEECNNDGRFVFVKLHFSIKTKEFVFQATVYENFSAAVDGNIKTIGANTERIFSENITPYNALGFSEDLKEKYRSFITLAFERVEKELT